MNILATFSRDENLVEMSVAEVVSAITSSRDVTIGGFTNIFASEVDVAKMFMIA